MDLSDRGRSLEEAYFKERDAKLIEERKKLEKVQKNKEELAALSGIKNPQVIDRLMSLGVSSSLLASLSILPLVEVAWADGELDEKERKAVLQAAAQGGLAEGSVDFHLLASWLKGRPSPKFHEAWLQYIHGLREVLSPQELEDLKVALLERARTVAEAAGGFMGMGSKISSEEQKVLNKLEAAFKA